MRRIRLALLRGVCQLPAYVAIEQGYFAAQDLAAEPVMAPTAWAVPERLRAGEVDFAVIPWTRVAADQASDGSRLVLVAGSGVEEAALVVRTGLAPEDVRRVAVPQEGGIKDLTAMALLRRLRWDAVRVGARGGEARPRRRRVHRRQRRDRAPRAGGQPPRSASDPQRRGHGAGAGA